MFKPWSLHEKASASGAYPKSAPGLEEAKGASAISAVCFRGQSLPLMLSSLGSSFPVSLVLRGLRVKGKARCELRGKASHLAEIASQED